MLELGRPISSLPSFAREASGHIQYEINVDSTQVPTFICVYIYIYVCIDKIIDINVGVIVEMKAIFYISTDIKLPISAKTHKSMVIDTSGSINTHVTAHMEKDVRTSMNIDTHTENSYTQVSSALHIQIHEQNQHRQKRVYIHIYIYTRGYAYTSMLR